MCNVKIGKTIIKCLEGLKDKGSILLYKAVDDSIEESCDSIDIKVKVNEVFSIKIYNEVNLMGDRTTGWVTECSSEDGEHMLYYSTDRTQKELCKTLEDRVKYGNVVHLNQIGEKYSDVTRNMLIKTIASRDIEINRLKKEVESYVELIEKFKKGVY